MNGKSPIISTALPFVLRLSKDERSVFQQNLRLDFLALWIVLSPRLSVRFYSVRQPRMIPLFLATALAGSVRSECRLFGLPRHYRLILTISVGAMVSLNSLPQLGGRQTGALCQRGKLEPGHAGIGIVEPQGGGGKPAVGSRDDVLAPDDLGEAHDPFGDQFREGERSGVGPAQVVDLAT